MKKYFFALVLFLLSIKGFSTHIVGGEIYYDCMGGSNYRITLKVYRDCINGVAPFDPQASIGVFNASGILVHNLMVTYKGSQLVQQALNPCLIPPTNICVEETIYDTVISLPAIPGGYNITYQRCCRNNTIQNLVIPGDVGATYTCHIPDASLAVCNSSPRFNNYPPIFLCVNNPFNFDHSATDPDGDLLVYEFADPLHGGSSVNSMPQPPAAPVYSTVPFLPAYSASYPMSSSPAMAVNGTSGLLTGTPNMLGQWVVGIRVKEYRNGQLISMNMRDFQFNVVTCPPNPVTSIPAQTSFCFGLTANFQNNSVNGNTWHWDFGDTLISGDTSNLKTPTWTYGQAGTYTVTLIANPGTQCADTGYTVFTIQPLLDPSFVPGTPQCLQGNSFNFTAGGSYQGAGTFQWVFGPNATPATSAQQNVSGVIFSAPGTYSVTLTISENGCVDSYTDVVTVLPQPVLTYSAPPVVGCSPLTVHFSDSSFSDTSVTAVLWDFGDGNSSMQFSPNHAYVQSGIYHVTVYVATNNPCIGNLTFTVTNMVTVYPSPKAGLTANPATITMFDSTITFTDISQGATSCWIYFGDGDSSGNCGGAHTYPASGQYTVLQVVENQYGCRDQFQLLIDSDLEALVWIPNAFTPNHDGKNELFMPVAMGVQNFNMMIFDRWGNLIFETNDIANGWNGKLKGNNCQEDVYVWKAYFEKSGDNSTIYKRVGHVTLVR